MSKPDRRDRLVRSLPAPCCDGGGSRWAVWVLPQESQLGAPLAHRVRVWQCGL